MYLSDFFKNAPQIQIDQLSCDSRIEMHNCIFFCVKGIKYNGHNYIDEAISNGANVIVYSDEIETKNKAIYVKVNNVEDTLINVSNKFYDYPSRKLESYIVSGTNGRSTVSYLINSLLSKTKKVSSIGTFGINYGDVNLYSNQPTLTILDNQKTLKQFVDEGCNACTLEASALSLSYKKLNMVKPNAFIYTSTYTDSPEYTESGLNYLDYLKHYIYSLDESTTVILNIDDNEVFSELYKVASINKTSYGLNDNADYKITNVKLLNNKSIFDLVHLNMIYHIETNLVSLPNVYNVTAALAALNQKGYDLNELIEELKEVECVDGIFDKLNFDDFNIYVDAANSVSAINNCLEFAKAITNSNNKIVSLVSINTTDSERRLKSIVNVLIDKSDLIIYTEDDTYEDDILDNLELASGLTKRTKSLIVEDREQAIETACEILNKGDTLLLLGKGNEDFLYKGLVKKNYAGDKGLAYKYINKRLREENALED